MSIQEPYNRDGTLDLRKQGTNTKEEGYHRHSKDSVEKQKQYLEAHINSPFVNQ